MRSPKAFISAFKEKHVNNARRATILLAMQAVLLCLLCATLILVFAVRTATFSLYMPLVSALALLQIPALILNIKGKYTFSAWITVVCVIAGPWISFLLDDFVARGDFVPLIYVTLSIQLCAVLLSTPATLAVGAVQVSALALFIYLNPALRGINWPSLLIFVVFVATLGSASSHISRRQVKQIEKQHNRLLQDEAQLRELSVRDPLTGLYNRRYMEDVLGREVERAAQGGHSLGVIMVDVDGFKAINDTFGHALGDRLLSHIAKLLLDNIRKTDAVCRYGGDEFVLILPDCPMQDCMDKAERLRAAVEATECKCGHVQIGKVCVSVGVAALPDDGLTAVSLLKAADDAMYVAKSEGKNRVHSGSGASARQRKLPVA